MLMTQYNSVQAVIPSDRLSHFDSAQCDNLLYK